MTYTDKVKESKKVLEAIQALDNDEFIRVAYGEDREGMPNYYKIRAYSGYRGEMSYSIYKDDRYGLDGMNIDSMAKTTMKAYTYDMMGQRTQYTFPLYMMHVLPEISN